MSKHLLDVYKWIAWDKGNINNNQPTNKHMRDISHLEEDNTIPLLGKQTKTYVEEDGKHYMLKYKYVSRNGKTIHYTHLLEYLSCKIAKQMGYGVQEVELVKYKGEIVVTIEMFSEELRSLTSLGSNTLGEDNLRYDLDEILCNFKGGKFDEGVEDYIWETFLLDAFICNSE